MSSTQPSLGHYHVRDGVLRADCEGCIEERITMLLLKGKTRAQALAIVEREVAEAYENTDNLPVRQVD